jgi:hypothetical protein
VKGFSTAKDVRVKFVTHDGLQIVFTIPPEARNRRKASAALTRMAMACFEVVANGDSVLYRELCDGLINAAQASRDTGGKTSRFMVESEVEA